MYFLVRMLMAIYFLINKYMSLVMKWLAIGFKFLQLLKEQSKDEEGVLWHISNKNLWICQYLLKIYSVKGSMPVCGFFLYSLLSWWAMCLDSQKGSAYRLKHRVLLALQAKAGFRSQKIDGYLQTLSFHPCLQAGVFFLQTWCRLTE